MSDDDSSSVSSRNQDEESKEALSDSLSCESGSVDSNAIELRYLPKINLA